MGVDRKGPVIGTVLVAVLAVVGQVVGHESWLPFAVAIVVVATMLVAGAIKLDRSRR